MPLVEPYSLQEAPGNKDVQLPREWRSKLQIIKWLGEGTFGKVFKCKVLCETKRDVYVSVKYIKEKSKLVRTEIGVLEKMKDYSDFCISAIGSPSYIEDTHGFWIMMPYMNHGDLHDFISKCHKNPKCNSGSREGRRDFTKVDPSFTEAYILVLFHDIVAGTEALQKKTGRIHTDLKPANVMVNCQNHMCFAAVIDLGLACLMQVNGCHGGGTPVYMPPEVWNQNPMALFSPARDVWALGVILYQLVYNRNPPFFANPQLLVHSYDVNRDPMIAGTKSVDRLIMQMLAKDWKKRPSLATIRKELELLVEEAAAPTRGAGGGKFKIGDEVEYFSNTYNQWLPAKITAVKDSDHYDLDIKEGALVYQLRPRGLPALSLAEVTMLRQTAEEPKYKKGDRIQVWSAKYGTWMDAKVMFVRSDGTYLLDHVKSATEDVMRWPQEGDRDTPPGGATPAPTVAPAVMKFVVGEDVEYLTEHDGWLPEIVLAANPDGTYNLASARYVLPERIRPLQQPQLAEPAAEAVQAPLPEPDNHKFKVGDVVQYYSTTNADWMVALVVKLKPHGLYDLDIKKDAEEFMMRFPPERQPEPVAVQAPLLEPDNVWLHKFKVGDVVQYYSTTKWEWVVALVVKQKPYGTYDLDIKKDVDESMMRFPPNRHEGHEEKVVQQQAAVPEEQPQNEAVDVPIEVKMLRSNAVQRGAALKMPSCL